MNSITLEREMKEAYDRLGAACRTYDHMRPASAIRTVSDRTVARVEAYMQDGRIGFTAGAFAGQPLETVAISLGAMTLDEAIDDVVAKLAALTISA